MTEPRTINPIIWGNRPIPGRAQLDFRPQVVPADAPMPAQLNKFEEPVQPVDEEGEGGDPKAPTSSATGSASPSVAGSDASGTHPIQTPMMTPTGPTSLSGSPAEPVDAEKAAPLIATRPALGLVPPVTGGAEPPAEPTG
jgi:hypothetical protein